MDEKMTDVVQEAIDTTFNGMNERLKAIAVNKAKALYKLGTNPELSEKQYVKKFLKGIGFK